MAAPVRCSASVGRDSQIQQVASSAQATGLPEIRGRIGLCLIADKETGGRGGTADPDQLGILHSFPHRGTHELRPCMPVRRSDVTRLLYPERFVLWSDRPKPAFRKVILDGDRRSDGRYLEISASSCPEGATLDWGWPPTYGSGPFALATPCTHVPGRYSGPSKFKSRVAHPWSWDIGSSTSAAQTSLNMVLSRRKARPFGLSTKLGLQENGRPSPKGTARVARALFDGLRNRGQRVFSKERAM